jgi:hypothetical protein
MGKRGPIPKREDQRRRRNTESKVDSVPFDGTPVAAPPADEEWHKIARDLYESLAESGQAQFYEPSDWQQAVWLAHETSRYLNSSKRSSMMFNYIWDAWGDLLTTEGARRRAKLEIERTPPASGEDEEAATIASLDEFRARAAG